MEGGCDQQFYDYYQHSYCIAIYMDERVFYALAFKSLFQNADAFGVLSEYSTKAFPAQVIYNKENGDIISWGDGTRKTDVTKSVKISTNEEYLENLLDEINRIYKKGEKNWDEKDGRILQVVGKVLQILVEQAKEKLTRQLQQSQQKTHKLPNNFHYVFITPSEENNTGIREKIFRPAFIATNLISKEDHLNRVLFFSTLETSVHHIESVLADRCYFTNKDFFNIGRDFQKMGVKYLICEILVYGEGLLSLKCNAFEFANFLPVDSNFTGLTPLISNSVPLSFALHKTAKSNLSNLLKDKGFEKKYWENEMELEKIMNAMMEYFEKHIKVHEYMNDGRDSNNIDDSTRLLKHMSKYWNSMKPINSAEVYRAVLAPIEKELMEHLNKFVPAPPKGKLIIIPMMDRISRVPFGTPKEIDWYTTWIEKMLTNYEGRFNYRLVVRKMQFENSAGGITHQTPQEYWHKATSFLPIDSLSLPIYRTVIEKIKLLNSIAPPNILIKDGNANNNIHNRSPLLYTLSEAQSTSAINITIYISLRSTKFSCSLLGDNGQLKEIVDEKHLKINTTVQPLTYFFDTSNLLYDGETFLKIEEELVYFMESHFGNTLDLFSKYDRHIVNKEPDISKPELLKGDILALHEENHTEGLILASMGEASDFFLVHKEEFFDLIARSNLDRDLTKDNKTTDSNTRVTITRQQKYIKTFLVIYFCYLYDTMLDRLSMEDSSLDFKSPTAGKSIRCLVNVEKKLLHDIIGSKEKLKELLNISGLGQGREDSSNKKTIGGALPIDDDKGYYSAIGETAHSDAAVATAKKENKYLNAPFDSAVEVQKMFADPKNKGNNKEITDYQIVTHEEGMLHILQIQQLNLIRPLDLKSYYLQAIIHEDYIQVTLNQVVRLESLEDEASAIIIRDEIIKTENFYDTVCNFFWDLIDSREVDTLVDHCNKHRQGDNKEIINSSLKNYEQTLVKLKKNILDLLCSSPTETNFSLDERSKLAIDNNCCSCSLGFSIRDIIELALKPAAMEIASVISTTLVSEVFGKYNIGHVFVLKNIFLQSTLNSSFSVAFSQIIKEAIDDNNHTKEKDPECFVLSKTLTELIMQPPKTGQSPISLGKLSKRIAHQVSRNTYGLCFNYQSGKFFQRNQEMVKILYQICGSDQLYTSQPGHAMIVLHKGQIIPPEGFKKTFYIEYEDRYSSGNIKPVLFKFDHFSNGEDNYRGEETISLTEVSNELVHQLSPLSNGLLYRRTAFSKFGLSVIPITIEVESLHHSSTLQLRLVIKLKNEIYSDIDLYKFETVSLAELLTVAYV